MDDLSGGPGDGLEPTNPLYWRSDTEALAELFSGANARTNHPTALASPPVMARILAYVAAGDAPTTACSMAGIAKSNWSNWQASANNGDKRYLVCLNLVERAESFGQHWHVDNIRKASESQWTASAWTLERRWPDDWGKRETHNYNHQGTVRQEHLHIHAAIPPLDRGKLLAMLSRPEIEDPADEPAIEADFIETDNGENFIG